MVKGLNTPDLYEGALVHYCKYFAYFQLTVRILCRLDPMNVFINPCPKSQQLNYQSHWLDHRQHGAPMTMVITLLGF